MNWIKKHKIMSAVTLIFVLLFGWFLFGERQLTLPYKITGPEILRVKEQCKNQAEAKLRFLKNRDSFSYDLVGYGYSEFQGYCYAEIIENYSDFSSKALYNTTEDKQIFTREWPKNTEWYNKDFREFVLGKHRIISF